MRYFYNSSRQTMLADKAGVADNFWMRLRGLLLRPPLQVGQGLYITPCPSIHMLGMAYAIDAVFLDSEGTIVGLVENLQPGKISGYYSKSTACLELPAGTICATKSVIGDKVTCGEVN